MKSSYELAMERLNKTAPAAKLTAAQKKQLAELETKTTAKIAEREIALNGEINAAAAAGDHEKAEELRKQLVAERKNLQANLEEKKESVRRKSQTPNSAV
jgi:hypothetical protein